MQCLHSRTRDIGQILRASGFFNVVRRVKGSKHSKGFLQLEFNMMLIKSICLVAIGAIWNFNCRTKYNHGYFMDISITCFFSNRDMCLGNVLSITSSRHMQYMTEMWGMSKFVFLFLIWLLKVAIFGVPHFKVKLKKLCLLLTVQLFNWGSWDKYLSFLWLQLNCLCAIFALESSWRKFQIRNVSIEIHGKWTIMSLES